MKTSKKRSFFNSYQKSLTSKSFDFDSHQNSKNSEVSEEREKKSILLIFDFDGTIADTKALYYNAIFRELKKFGFSYKEVDKAIDVGMSLRKTLRNLGFNKLYLWYAKRKIMKDMIRNVDKVKKCKDIDTIKKIKQNKILISNSLKEFIIPIIRHFKLNKEFKEIYGADDFTGKAEFIRRYLKEHNINKQDCFYIGDRVADVKVAKKVGCKSVIITGACAWDSRKEILKQKPNFIINDLRDLKKIID